VFEQVFDTGFSLEEGLLVVEKHFCFELFQDTILDIIPGQITINPAFFFFEELVSFLKILGQACRY
jgi:hypothetical protein